MPEFISMNAMMAGVVPTMSLLMMGRDMRAMDPLKLVIWGVMSLGVMVGFMTAYPFNVWMAKKKLKHGPMTACSGEKQEMGQMKGHDMSQMSGPEASAKGKAGKPSKSPRRT